MRFSSVIHSPKSIKLQRSLQKGRQAECGVQGTVAPQMGQLTWLGFDGCTATTDCKLSTRRGRSPEFDWGVPDHSPPGIEY